MIEDMETGHFACPDCDKPTDAPEQCARCRADAVATRNDMLRQWLASGLRNPEAGPER